MPSTATGLIFFVFLLAPGLSFSAYRAASTPVRKPSALRELGGIVLRSAVWDTAALGVFGIIRSIAPSHTPDAGAIAREPSVYLRQHYAYVFWWAVGLLAFACAAAILGALAVGSDRAQVLLDHAPLKWVKPKGAVSPNPSWWVLFNQHPDKQVYAGVALDDGTYLSGWVLSFSPDSDETADREITLSGPVMISTASSPTLVDLGVGAVAISARRIQYLTVSYVDPSP